jgi:hypothetical protein
MPVVSGQSEGTVEVTPSGIPVYYQSQPKRLYRIGDHEALDGLALESLLTSAQNQAECWREVPSVTQVLDCLAKNALPWWGMKVGVEGTLELARARLNRELVPFIYESSIDDVIAELTEHKLTVNHVRDKAGARGQAVHDAFEAWARTGFKPDPSIYPDEERGYVEGLLAFLDDVPSIEPIAVEVLVASAEHGYAGRYDIRFRTSAEHEVVVHRTRRKITTRKLAPGTYLGDLKSSKGIYPSHARQLEGYEQASIESGYEPTDGRGILHVGMDGTYEFVRSWATVEDFLCVLAVWQSDEDMKARK